MSTAALVRAFYAEIWNSGNLDAVPRILSEEVVFRGSLGDERRGHAGFAAYVQMVRNALDDYRCEILDLVSEEPRAFTRMRFAGIHAGTMTEAEALELMVQGGFQEESEARNKWDRARLTSTQLSTYFVGSAEMWDLEREARRRAAAASGDPRGADAVPEPRIVGDFGETPGFRYRDYLESALAHGSPPTPLLRRILFGD